MQVVVVQVGEVVIQALLGLETHLLHHLAKETMVVLVQPVLSMRAVEAVAPLRQGAQHLDLLLLRAELVLIVQ
jgi:hypothetical protein